MKTKIGGQAVLEGVMMRGESSIALAVRDENGDIRIDSKRLSKKKPWYRKVPFLRGVVNLVLSMVEGMKIIGKSAEVIVEDEIDTSDGKGMGAMMTFSILLGVALAIFLFVFVPTQLTALIMMLFSSDAHWLKSLLEGVFKMLVLVGYMSIITTLKDIRRLFMYHGAEHKTISCYENELPLTVENVQKCSRYHDRCGTSFIVFVLLISIVVMYGVEAIFYACGAGFVMDIVWARFLIKLALLPLTAGISYEFLMLLARSNFILFRPFKWLGKQMQRLTTREPDDGMCEVAITAFRTVLHMDADETVEEKHFPAPLSFGQVKAQMRQEGCFDGIADRDVDWMMSRCLNVSLDKLNDDLKIPFGWQTRLRNAFRRCKEGEPVQYVVGNTEFYGRNFKLTDNVLIPRQETELVCEQALKQIRDGQKVLDLCCGSGVLGITVALQKKAKVTLADVSEKALDVARKNAHDNKARVKFVRSDMFRRIKGKFDVIICNPPYVESDVIETLDDSVKKYEPHLALDGGKDGLRFYRILALQAHEHLTDNGVMVLEIGYNQGQTVPELLGVRYDTQVIKDYGGNDRIVIARLKKVK